MQRFINNWSAVLAAPATTSAVSISVPSPAAAKLGALSGGDYYLLTLAAVDAAGAETAWEIIKVTAVSGGTLTVVRGQEGSTPLDWPTAAAISARATKGTLEALQAAAGIAASDAVPQPLGAASAGVSPAASRADHIHAKPTPADIGAATSAQGAKADSAVQPAALIAALADKVDKALGYGLSQENYTPAEKSKLAGLEAAHFKGLHASLIALQAAHPSAVAGDYADVDSGVGVDVARYIWDVSDSVWIIQSGASGSMTAAQIKTAYEANADTNAFSDAEKSKLGGVAAGATANADTDSLAEGATNKWFTAARVIASVLTGLSVATGGAVVSTDSVLVGIGKLQRQLTDLIATVGGKQDALVSGTNIKTVNGASLLGAGDLAVTAASAATVTESTTARTLALIDAGKYLRHTNAGASTVTVPLQSSVAWSADTEVHIRRAGAGTLTITPASGVTLNAPSGGTLVMADRMSVTLKRVGSDAWDVIGQTVAA